ncbi:hypothetical protein ACFWBV_03420 [Streptomyces sp. NPDC060030]|uniref:hypothetical protein n=1 Tax=Streptomyces sp. NPDC060030 TaxID=3347042 RepID=UPI0036BAFADC
MASPYGEERGADGGEQRHAEARTERHGAEGRGDLRTWSYPLLAGRTLRHLHDATDGSGRAHWAYAPE